MDFLDLFTNDSTGVDVPSSDISANEHRVKIGSMEGDADTRRYVFGGKVKGHDGDLELKDVALFESDFLLSVRADLKLDDTVKDRREKQIDNGSRSVVIYNEAVKFGVQAGLASTLKGFVAEIDNSSGDLDEVWNFRALMIHGGMVIPPVVSINSEVVEISSDKTEYLFVDKRYKIMEQAKFSRKAPTYRDYLYFNDYKVAPPSRFSVPYTENEITHWSNGVLDGWEIGVEQATNEIKNKLSALSRDYIGMRRYNALEMMGVISPPKISNVKTSVSGDSQAIDVGKVSIKMNFKPSFNLDTTMWEFLLHLDKLEKKIK